MSGADVAFLVEHRRAEPVEAEAAATLSSRPLSEMPPCSPSMTLCEPRRAVGDGVVAHFDADLAPPHLVRDRRRGAGAEKGVEHEVAGVGGDSQ